MSVKAALIVFAASESSKSSSVNFLPHHLEPLLAAGQRSVSWPSLIGRSWRWRLTWDRSGHAPNFLAPSQMAARHKQMGPQRPLAPVLLEGWG